MSESSVRLSVAIIARDDAEALKKTILSIQRVADEIVVLDTGSMDASRGEARKLGAQVFDFTWCDDFAAARNACAEHTSGEWVLWLDTGETLDADDATAMREFVLHEADPARVYAMLVRVAPSSAASAAEQVARIRLVPGGLRLEYVGRVRESLVPTLIEAGLEMEGVPFIIRRGLREHELARRVEKAQRNIRLAEIELREAENQPQLLNCLGDAFQTLNDNQRAAKFFQHALDCAATGSVDALEAYYGLLTSLDGTDNRQTQLDLAVQASEAFPLDAQLLCAIGGYLQAIGRTDVAAQSYETVVQYGQVNPSVWHVAEVRDIATICYSITLQLLKRDDTAVRVLEGALECEQPSGRIRRHLIELLAKHGNREAALEHVSRLPKETPHREAMRSAVRGACLAAKQNWIAAKAYLKTAYTAGCREPLCLRWYAVSLSSNGENEETIRVLEEWQQSDPENGEVKRLLAAAKGQDGSNVAIKQLRVDPADHAQRMTPTLPPSARRTP